MKFLSFITERIKSFFSGGGESSPSETDSAPFERKEKAIAFGIALFIAISLWFIVNLNRDFNVTVQVPVQLSNLPDDQILSNSIPDQVSVNVSGEGWQLITVYNNPPRILLNAENQNINLAEQVRNQIGAFNDINIIQVQPATITIETEQKATKTVLLQSQVDISLRGQYGFLSEPKLSPDSVNVTGPASLIDQISEWQTRQIELTNVNGSLTREIPLETPEGNISVEPSSATLSLEIAEFTEAEVRVPIRTRNLPSDQAVTYNPSSVTVRFDVPINQYSEIQGTRPFTAYVEYSSLVENDSGRIAPEIEVNDTNYIIRLRSFQPPRVSYFMVVSE